MESKKTYFLLVVAVIFVFAACVVSVMLTDQEPPEITFSEAGMVDEYVDGADMKELLKGVTAYDAEDGDVTHTLSVVNVVVMAEGKSAQITYAARDSRNNITKKNYKMDYAGSKSFIDISTVDDETEEETTFDPKTKEGGSGKPKRINQKKADETGIPQIELMYTDYTIHVGDTFGTTEALSIVKMTYDSTEVVSSRIVINGIAVLDTEKEGEYVLSYSVTDSEGNQSDEQTLIVHVVE